MTTSSKFTRKELPRGELNPNRKLCWEKVAMIREERELYGTSYEKIAYMFGISKRQVMRVVQGECWPPAHQP